jgi:hypothetical protein
MFFSNVVHVLHHLVYGSTPYKADRKTKTMQRNPLKHCGLLRGIPRVFCSLQGCAVGFLTVLVMRTVAAYDLCQVLGWKHGLHAKPAQAKEVPILGIAVFTVIGMGMNFFDFNPVKLSWLLAWSKALNTSAIAADHAADE